MIVSSTGCLISHVSNRSHGLDTAITPVLLIYSHCRAQTIDLGALNGIGRLVAFAQNANPDRVIHHQTVIRIIIAIDHKMPGFA